MERKEFYIAGVKFHQMHTVMSELEEDMELLLVREPDNKYDPNAVKIIYEQIPDTDAEPNQVMLGYVPAKISAEVAAMLDMDDPDFQLSCFILEVNPSAKPWEQCKVEIVETIDADEILELEEDEESYGEEEY